MSKLTMRDLRRRALGWLNDCLESGHVPDESEISSEADMLVPGDVTSLCDLVEDVPGLMWVTPSIYATNAGECIQINVMDDLIETIYDELEAWKAQQEESEDD